MTGWVVLLAASLLVTGCGTRRAAENVYHTPDAPGSAGGELSPDIRWHIEAGTLYVSGQGAVPTTMLGEGPSMYDSRSLFQSVVIGEGITEVGELVFNFYKNIASLTIAGSVEGLADGSFSGCSKLRTVEVRRVTPPNIDAGTFLLSKVGKARLIVPPGSKPAYQADPNWKKFGTIEESDQLAAYAVKKQIETLKEPCAIYLTRSSNFVGAARKVGVILNGTEQPEKLSNGETIRLYTDRSENEISLKVGKTIYVTYRFKAKEGGKILFAYSYFDSKLKIEE
jgi:hypothetical protein